MKRVYSLLLLFTVFIAVVIAILVIKQNHNTELTAKNFTEPTIYITVKHGAKSDEYIAEVSAACNPGIAGCNIALAYDSNKLTPLYINEGKDYKSGLIFSSNLINASEEQISGMEAVTTVWAAASNNTNNGILYSVIFRSIENTIGETELSLISRGIGNAAEMPVNFDLLGAVIDLDSIITDNSLSTLSILLIVFVIFVISIFITWFYRKVIVTKSIKQNV